MDPKPILLPLAELQTRKAHELKARGYSRTEIAEAMGLREAYVTELLANQAPRKSGTAAATQAA